MARHTLTENLRIHFNVKNFIPELEKIVQSTVKKGKPLSMIQAVTAIKAATQASKVIVNGPSLRSMLKKLSPAYHIKATSILGQLIRIKRGAQPGCKGRNIFGRSGKPTTVKT